MLNSNKTNTKATLRIFKKLEVKIVDSFAEEILKNIYPIKKIKRILYHPLNGRWYPHIDIESTGYHTQLSFFYGKLNLFILEDRFCSDAEFL